MTCNILTEDRWKRFMQDKLSKEESLEIYDHLDTDCPDCEAFIATMSIDEEAKISEMCDDLSDQNLLSMTANSNVAVLNLPGFMPSMVKGNESSNRGIGLSQHLTSWVGGIAALLLISVGILPQLYLDSSSLSSVGADDIMKSKGLVTQENAFKLEFLTGQRKQDGRLVIESGLSGRDYNESTLMLFRYKTFTSGYLYLIGIAQDTGAEILYPLEDASVKQSTEGEFNVSDNDEIIAYPLTGLHGRYTVVGIFAPNPLEMDKRKISEIQRSVDPMTGAINKNSLESIGNNVEFDSLYFDIGT